MIPEVKIYLQQLQENRKITLIFTWVLRGLISGLKAI